ncbi:MAG: hypothetical protein D6769_01825 [Methanobacteriota archaeon]|nr:MAG: hypothetical protein D6769_01825 [Euryarchaeota archaeon]
MKGQYFTLDVIVAAIMAVISIMLLLGYWQYSLENSPIIQDSLNKQAIRVSQLFFSISSDYSLLEKKGLLINDTAEMEKRAAALNKTLPYNLCLMLKFPDNSESVFGCPPLASNQAKIERVAYFKNSSISSPVLVEIFLSK